MADPRRKAVIRHRRQQRARGFVRVEVQARKGDAELIARVAKALRGEDDTAERVRLAVQTAVAPLPTKSLNEMLASAPWDDAFEREILRDKSLPRVPDL